MGVPTSEIFRVSALIDRLVGPGETFSAAEAAELIALVPLTKRPRLFQMKTSITSSGSENVGVTSAGTAARIDSDAEKTFRVGHDQTVRVGRYVLRHQKGRLDISDFMQGPDETENNACRLIYKAPATPLNLLWFQPVVWQLGALKIARMAYKPWKSPV